jgi:hypothetical protein
MDANNTVMRKIVAGAAIVASSLGVAGGALLIEQAMESADHSSELSEIAMTAPLDQYSDLHNRIRSANDQALIEGFIGLGATSLSGAALVGSAGELRDAIVKKRLEAHAQQTQTA